MARSLTNIRTIGFRGLLVTITLIGTIPGCSSTRCGTQSVTSAAITIYTWHEPECPYKIMGPISIETEGSVADYNHGAKSRYHDLLIREVRLHGGHAVIGVAVQDLGIEQVILSGDMIQFTDPNCMH